MDILKNLVFNGDIFQTVGEIKLSSSDIPLLTNGNELCFADNSIKIDVTPLFNLTQDSCDCVLKSTDNRVVFNLSFDNGLLDGICSVWVCNTLVCEGRWQKGQRMGYFHEYCCGTEVFDGKYKDGVRYGKALIRVTLDDSPQLVVFRDNSPLYYSIEQYYDRTILLEYDPVVLLSKIMVSSELKRSGFVINYQHGQLSNVELWKEDHFLYTLKRFTGDRMTCFNEFKEVTYAGQYCSLSSIWFVMHGEGTQFLNGSIYYNGTMRYGKRQGYGRLYYHNGKVKYEGFWSDDEPDGDGVIYDKDGLQFCTCHCKNGTFQYGFRTYNVFSFAPMNPILSWFSNSSQKNEYSVLNQLFIPSTYFDLAFAKSPFPEIKSGYDLRQSVSPVTISPFLTSWNRMKPFLRVINLTSSESIVSVSQIHIHNDQEFDFMIDWDLSILMKLESLILDDCSMANQSSFIVKSVPVLKNIQIGNNCFNHHRESNNQEDGQFQLIDCPHLITVTIGGDSFQDYSSINVISELDTFFSFSRLSSTSSVSPS